MKGISGRVTSGLPTQARLECVDNTGAKVVQLITVLKKGGVARRYPSAGVGDMIRVTVRRGTPETRRQIYTAVIVRQSRPFRRVDGHGYNSRTTHASSPTIGETSRVPTSRDLSAGKRPRDGQG